MGKVDFDKLSVLVKIGSSWTIPSVSQANIVENYQQGDLGELSLDVPTATLSISTNMKIALSSASAYSDGQEVKILYDGKTLIHGVLRNINIRGVRDPEANAAWVRTVNYEVFSMAALKTSAVLNYTHMFAEGALKRLQNIGAVMGFTVDIEGTPASYIPFLYEPFGARLQPGSISVLDAMREFTQRTLIPLYYDADTDVVKVRVDAIDWVGVADLTPAIASSEDWTTQVTYDLGNKFGTLILKSTEPDLSDPSTINQPEYTTDPIGTDYVTPDFSSGFGAGQLVYIQTATPTDAAEGSLWCEHE